MKTNETASVKMVIDLSDYQNVDSVVIVLKKSQEEQIKRVQPKTKKELSSCNYRKDVNREDMLRKLITAFLVQITSNND